MSDTQTSSSSESASSAKRIEIPFYDGRDDAKIMERFDLYPETLEELQNTNIFVSTIAVAFNRELVESFVDEVEKGEKTHLDLVTFTVEGDSCPVYIQYDGNDFYYIEYTGRDSYGKGNELYPSEIYKYLSLIEIPNDEYEDIDFTGIRTGNRSLVLSDKIVSTDKECEKLVDGGENVHVIPVSAFTSEQELKEHMITE